MSAAVSAGPNTAVRPEAQYQCPLCSFASDVDIDAHLGLHLRLVEFQEMCGNLPSSSFSSSSSSSSFPSSTGSLDHLVKEISWPTSEAEEAEEDVALLFHSFLRRDFVAIAAYQESATTATNTELTTISAPKSTTIAANETPASCAKNEYRFCDHCGIEINERDLELHVLRHQLGSQYLLM